MSRKPSEDHFGKYLRISVGFNIVFSSFAAAQVMKNTVLKLINMNHAISRRKLCLLLRNYFKMRVKWMSYKALLKFGMSVVLDKVFQA